MIKTTDYVNKLMDFPLPDRRAVENIIREIYNAGVQEQKRRVLVYLRKNIKSKKCPLCKN